ncbi:MAG: hypothetical protein HY368_01465 [Candidatus Aenigmarchaeota archaeon]|nr:hypothetical protein [Candidatus Aenigmarchaeota archaeon]
MKPSNMTLIPVLLLVFAAACIASIAVVRLSDGTLQMKVSPDPDEIFIDGLTNIYVDVTNRDVKTLNAVSIDVFETGLLELPDKKEKCEKLGVEMKPNQSFTLRCTLRARPDITESSVQSDIHVRAQFETKLNIVQPVEFITQDWFERQRLLGEQPKPRKYAYADKNVLVTVEFSDGMPLVVRDNTKYYMYLTIENIGDGVMTQIAPPTISYSDKSDFARGVAKECKFETLYIVGKKFPRVACEITQPDIADQKTIDLILGVAYNYDIRDTATVKIKK